MDRRLIPYLSITLALGLSSCGDDGANPGPSVTYSTCSVSAYAPYGCATTDALDFESVVVGNSLSTQVNIENVWGGDIFNKPPNIRVSVTFSGSDCEDFEWTGGDGLSGIPPGEIYLFGVVFHPKSPGLKTCTLKINGCTEIALTGLGITENPNVPAHHPAYNLVNQASYEALFSVAFDRRTALANPWERDSLFVVVTPGSQAQLRLPTNTTLAPGQYSIRNVNVRGSAATGSAQDPWAPVLDQFLANALEKCFRLTGDSSSPAWSEIACALYRESNCGSP